ncbi:arylamine N-acetyltransferase family protein [Brevibacillus reuszeri]|uniref:arylamine N-acetyltransferase family protein n=1 Tax=Brevibacillus reuszeri TaxID=54915 RepID=UPI0028A2C17A|nr:arylamine N-acetyltransferase [Brevibacillus reuszeri]
MSEINALFRNRIGLSETEPVTFESLGMVLDKTASRIPFENGCILQKDMSSITKDYLRTKMLVKKEGGLCYELNSLFYFFLIENGFQAVLTRGVVYKPPTQQFLTIGRTHVANLLTHEGQTYVIDTGFGGNLPLQPVPLTGETISSRNGEFRVKQAATEYGNYVLEMKLAYKDTDWRIGYAFDSNKPVTNVSEFDEIQEIIANHAESPFNKTPLLTRFTNTGTITLTDSSFTQWVDGRMSKEQIDSERFKELRQQHFGINQ